MSVLSRQRTALSVEGLALLLVAPFLLFPGHYPALVFIALILLPLSWFISWRLTQTPFPKTPYNAAMLLFSAAVFLSVVVTADPEITLPKATGLILGIASWRFLTIIGQKAHGFKIVLATFILCSGAFTLFGLVAAEWRFKIPFLAHLLDQTPVRLIHLSDGPAAGVSLNQVAGAMMFYWLLPFSYLLGWQGRLKSLKPILFLSLAFVAAIILLLTQSRSGWIGGFAGLLSLLLLWGFILPSSRRKRLIWVVFSSIAGASLFLLLVIGPARTVSLLQEPMVETVVGDLSTTYFRQEMWQWSLVGIQDFPFTGVGLGAFRQVAFRLYPINVPANYDFAHAHNIFLQTALDIGLPGLVAYLALVSAAIFSCWRLAQNNEALQPLFLGLLAGFIGLHIYGISDALAIGAKPHLLFWLALSLMSVHQPDKQPASSKQNKQKS